MDSTEVVVKASKVVAHVSVKDISSVALVASARVDLPEQIARFSVPTVANTARAILE